MLHKTIARRACDFNFLASQQKVKKKKFLSGLCALSEAGGELREMHAIRDIL